LKADRARRLGCAAACCGALILMLCACAREEPAGAKSTASDLAPHASGTATLSWEPPRRNTDGSDLRNVAGYFIYYGRNPSNLKAIVKISDPFVTTFTVDRLDPGTYYFRIQAFTSSGVRGELSPLVSKTMR
jgi:hypothetical protein